MSLQELLKKYLNDDAKVAEFEDEMKKEKIYTSTNENIDIRYGKLKGDFDALVTKDKESQTLIEQLKEASKGSDEAQTKIKEYETRIAELERQNEELTIDNAIKFGLLAKGAKASDVDYLIYRAKNGDTELKLDKDGNVKGLDDLIDGLKKTYSGNFEEKAQKRIEEKKLPGDEKDKNAITKEQFSKMGYAERNKLFKENREQYDELSKGE